MVLAHRGSTRIEQRRGGVIRKKIELEHVLKKENIDICCIQETYLQKKTKDLE